MKRYLKWIPAFMCFLSLAGCAPKQPPIITLIQLLQENKHDEAIELAEKLVAEDPNNSQAYRFLIQAVTAKGETEKYRTKYQDLIAANPNVAGYHFALGYVHTNMQDLDAAVPEFQKAIELNPSIEYAHFMLGWIHMMQPDADYEKALAEWKKEEQLNPQSLGALQVYTTRADYYLRIGNAEDAEKDYEKIAMYAFAPGDRESARQLITQIRSLRDEMARLEAEAKNKPDDPDVHYQLGILQYKNSRVKEAIETWLKAVELDAENAELRNYLGKALLEEGRHEEAARQLQKAIELNPNMPTVYYNLAVAEEFTGETALAVEHYKKYIELNPMAPKLEAAKQRVATLEGEIDAGEQG